MNINAKLNNENNLFKINFPTFLEITVLKFQFIDKTIFLIFIFKEFVYAENRFQ